MLRVEGQQNGESGYFYKMINDSAWEFQKTGHIINRPFLLPDKSAKKIEPFRINYEFTGILKKNDTKTSLNIVLNDFNFIGSPCKINILYNGKKLKISNKELVLFFHYRHTLVKRKRSVGYWENGDFANIRGAIVIPDEYRKEIEKLENEDFKLLLKNIFGTMNVINLHGTASLKGIKMDELSFWDLFRAPKDEKAFNSRYLLNLERKFN